MKRKTRSGSRPRIILYVKIQLLKHKWLSATGGDGWWKSNYWFFGIGGTLCDKNLGDFLGFFGPDLVKIYEFVTFFLSK